MPRTIAALYDSRAEAELARKLLVEELKIKPPTIVGRDTLGAIDGFRFDRKDMDAYRDGVRRGAHLLVATVEEGASARQIVELLKAPVAGNATPAADEASAGDAAQGDDFRIADEGIAEPATAPSAAAREEPAQHAAPAPPAEAPIALAGEKRETAPPPPAAPAPAPAPVEDAHVPALKQELRVGKQEVVRGGARVRSFTRETPAEEQVSLQEEVLEVDSRPSEGRLSDSELESGGLFRERVFEIAQMREEPVVTKVAVVREEVIVRKTIKERIETIRDTVRHTEVEVEDLASETPAMFGDASSGGPRRP
jgi:stress response protein YsnF